MSFLEIIDTLLFKSLELVLEVVYMLTYKIIGNPGMAIIALSLFMNFLVLPLYMRADAIQEEEHAVEKKLQKGVDHIKKTFSGDERMMILQTYYRQNHYKPVYVLRSAVSLLLQIPFFIAAYRFLSGLSLLNGASFGPISNLGSQDGLLQIGGVSFNVLPVIMTVVNLASCVIFTKGSSFKAKIQLYAMALFFLVFLYTSPAGLVFYWTLNNVFSLVKTIFYKLKNPGKILGILCSGCGIMMTALGFFVYRRLTIRKIVFIAAIVILIQAPLIWGALKGKIKKSSVEKKENRKIFFGGAVFLAILTGILVPSAVIGASPLEFIKLTNFYNPLWYVVSSGCLACGLFVLWAGVFYFLAKPAARVYFDKAVWILAGTAMVNYMFFGRNMGLLNKELIYENRPEFAGREQIINLLVVFLAAVVFWEVYRYRERLVADVLIVGVIAVFCMSAVNTVGINREINRVKERDLEQYTAIPQLKFSKTGKNVVVIMLDRAVGEFVPYLMQEKPELLEQFSGFTYYANTISFGGYTFFGSPVLFGGYEYTPVEMNRRDEELLVDKHNEALKVMPTVFSECGYDVIVSDPPYAGYEEIPDLSIYDELPGVQSYILKGKFTEDFDGRQGIADKKRNFFCFSIMKISPLCLQKTIYDYGLYQQAPVADIPQSKQVADGLYRSVGVEDGFMDSYRVLENLAAITEISEEDTDAFFMLTNDTTHDVMLLQEPDFVPAMVVDNEAYETSYGDKRTIDGHTLELTSPVLLAGYQGSMAAFLQLGNWFDYLREQGVYDNTRIILAADHGKKENDLLEAYRLGTDDDIRHYYPLLMMKDFDSEEFTTSEEFMTNGDVPTLAFKDLVENPINPFTGKVIDSGEKTAHDQYITASDRFLLKDFSGNTYLPSKWYAVHDDMRDINNWKLLSEEETTLPPVDEESNTP